MKIRPLGAELLHADGRTGRRDDANSRFSNFAYTSKNPTFFERSVIGMYLMSR
jgi:hypothetical protein